MHLMSWEFGGRRGGEGEERGEGGGRGGKGGGGGKDGMNRVGDKEFKTVVEPVQLSVLMSNFLKVILWI